MHMLRMLVGVAALVVFAPVLADDANTSASAEPIATKSAEPRDCIRDTGTRIRHREGECTGAPGRSYTREEIDNSGAVSVGEALRTLDPRVGLRR